MNIDKVTNWTKENEHIPSFFTAFEPMRGRDKNARRHWSLQTSQKKKKKKKFPTFSNNSDISFTNSTVPREVFQGKPWVLKLQGVQNRNCFICWGHTVFSIKYIWLRYRYHQLVDMCPHNIHQLFSMKSAKIPTTQKVNAKKRYLSSTSIYSTRLVSSLHL